MSARVVFTDDEEQEARIQAEVRWKQGRRVGVMTTLDWNRAHPEALTRTVNRWVVYEETPDAAAVSPTETTERRDT